MYLLYLEMLKDFVNRLDEAVEGYTLLLLLHRQSHQRIVSCLIISDVTGRY